MPAKTYTIPAKPKNDDEHLELIARIIFVIGFNYKVVEQRWPLIKKAFHDFSIEWVSKAKVEDLLGKPGVINNKRKIATIIENAQTCNELIKKHGSMQSWVKEIVKANKKDLVFSPSFAEVCEETFKGIGKTTREWLAYVFVEGKTKPEKRTVE